MKRRNPSWPAPTGWSNEAASRSAAGAAGILLPGHALAQLAARKLRVLVLHSAPIPSGPYHGALRERLAVRGFVEGKNLILDAPGASTAGLDYMRQDLAKLLVHRGGKTWRHADRSSITI